ncbi:MAG: hypothetical protein ACR2FP_10660 [Nocardioidaceae bacterium]
MSARRITSASVLASVLASVTVASVLIVPAAATAASPAPHELARQSAPRMIQQAGRYDTAIRFLDFDHTRPFMRRANIRGQVAATIGDRRGGLKGAAVKLYRKIAGTSTWRYVDTASTSHTDYPRFRFAPRSLANATYRVVFAGNDRLQASRGATSVAVHRTFDPRMEDGTGRFHGQMGPRYAHRLVLLEKRPCARCGWRQVSKDFTGDYSRWSFKVGAPVNGRWWWRVSAPAATRFIRSFSGIYTTELR